MIEATIQNHRKEDKPMNKPIYSIDLAKKLPAELIHKIALIRREAQKPEKAKEA